MRVLIVGGGVIGTSIAYCLASRGAEVIVIERSAVACAASGKSGGFLALDWCDGTPLMHLARRSFALHAELARDLGGDWGYRCMTTYAGAVGGIDRPTLRRSGPRWVSSDVAINGQIGSVDTTAQVHPAAFTSAMMRAAEEQGAELRMGQVTGLLRRGGYVIGVQLEDGPLEGDAVVIAMGPWSVLAAGWLPLPPVYGLKGHSLVFETGAALPPEALFLEYAERAGSMLSPEVFPRADGTTYVCGISTETPVPVDPGRVAPDEGAIDRLQALCARVSPVLAQSRVLASQACYRPVTGGWSALGRCCAGRKRCLRGHGSQRLGHSQRACNGRGDGRTDPGGQGANRRYLAIRSCTPCSSRSRTCRHHTQAWPLMMQVITESLDV